MHSLPLIKKCVNICIYAKIRRAACTLNYKWLYVGILRARISRFRISSFKNKVSMTHTKQVPDIQKKCFLNWVYPSSPTT